MLLVDDDPGLLRLLSLRLEAEGYTVYTAANGHEALRLVTADRPDVVMTDLRMDGLDGAALLDELGRRAPGLPVIVLTAHGSIPEAVELTRLGAFGFLTKPVEREAMLKELEGAVALSAKSSDDEQWREHVITRSPLMEELLTQAKRVAQTQAGVLILGPGGSGKELLARAIHLAGGRSGEFVALNCGAVPAEMFESELFGHVQGASTGAAHDHPGLMQAARGGTLFLDEVAGMPLAQQVKLLRALQDKRARPVGGDVAMDVDVRVIAASQDGLEDAVNQGTFREDLYYRLAIVELKVPPLSERREDIPLLVNYKLEELAAQGRSRHKFSPQALETLASAPWPGNVRQLFNVVEKTTTIASGPVVSTRLVTNALGDGLGAMSSLAEAQDAFTRDFLIRLLRMTEGNVSKAARLAKRNRTDFYRLLTRHDIDWAHFKRSARKSREV
ncbi:MAG: sigma 54-interacting transcriptional regulator [Gammaproteobacteria bacterium]